MSGQPAAVENLRAKIGEYLRAALGRYEVTRDGSYSLRHGSTRLMIKPVALPDSDKTIVNLLAFVNIDVNVNNDLVKYLMDLNKNILFGKFVVLEDQKMVLCQHSLLGEKLDQEELMVGIAAIVLTADKYDDEIKARFGGMRVIDAENEALRRFPGGYTGGTMEGPP